MKDIRFVLCGDGRPLSLPSLVLYLKDRTGIKSVDIKHEILHGRNDEVAIKFAKCRVIKITESLIESKENRKPLFGEIEYEKRIFEKAHIASGGVLYDGFLVQEIFAELLGEEMREKKFIIITKRFLGTYDEFDKRYHGRTVILGNPALISTTGIFEALAKPKEFYILKQKFSLYGEIPEEILEMEFKGRILSREDDPRILEILKGYVMQVFFYLVFGEAFCDVKACRLFNAHWQEDAIFANTTEPEFCERHEEMIRH